MKTYSSIIRPIITEKSSLNQASGQYTFLLASRSITKIDVKQAVEKIYGVKVATVRTMIKSPKTRFIGRRAITKRKPVKIAIVTLKDKKTIDPNKVTESKLKTAKPKSTKTAAKTN